MIIEQGIPIPPRKWGSGKGRARLYDFGRLDPGACMFIPSKREKSRRRLAASVAGSMYRWMKLHPGMRYTLRNMGDGVRVWRTQ